MYRSGRWATQIAGVPVYHADTLESFLAEHPASVGLLTVPKSAAQEMGERLVAAGVQGIWNFTNYECPSPGRCGGGERPLLRQSAGPQLYDLPAGGRRGRGRKGADMRRKTARLLLSGGVLAAVLSGGAAALSGGDGLVSLRDLNEVFLPKAQTQMEERMDSALQSTYDQGPGPGPGGERAGAAACNTPTCAAAPSARGTS